MSGNTAPTAQELCARAQGVFDSFDESDITSAIEEAERYISQDNWSGRYCDGVFYLAAHILTVTARIREAGDAASSADAMPAGPMRSEKILSWSASYEVGSGDNDDAVAAALKTTTWGREYLWRCSLVFSCRTL